MDALEALLNAYEVATQSWLDRAVTAGNELFRRLAALELVVFGLVVAVSGRKSAANILPELTWKLFLIALLLTLLLLYPLWMPRITPTFAVLAGQISGTVTLNPAKVVAQGIALGIVLLASAITTGWGFANVVGSFIGALAALGVVIAYIAMAAILAITLIESWMVLSAGPLFLGFAPFRLTAQIADNFIGYAFYVGFKLLFLLLLVSAMTGVTIQWAALLAESTDVNLQLSLEILAGAVIMAVTLWSIPKKLAEVLTRNWDVGIRRGLSD